MPDSPPPETLEWLRQAAAVDGYVEPQLLLHLLERLEALEKKYETQRLATLEWGKDVDKLMRWSDKHLKRIMALEQRPVPGTVELAAPTPEAAPVATDAELLELADDSDMERLEGERSTGGTVIKEGCWEAWDHQLLPFARAVYNLGRKHGAAAAQPADHVRLAPLLWLLWNHQGSGSPVGQPIRKYLGMGQFQGMTKEQVEAAKSWGSIPFPAQPAPPAVAIYAALERLVKLRNTDTHALLGSDWHEAFVDARAALAQPPAAQPAPPAAPAALSDALLQAECALSDIAEGEETNAAPSTFDWAEQRCVKALDTIRPVMRDHGIRTSEWPGCGFSPPQPAPPAAPAGGLVERVAEALRTPYESAMPLDVRRVLARAAIAAVAAWLDQQGQHGCSLWLREEADR